MSESSYFEFDYSLKHFSLSNPTKSQIVNKEIPISVIVNKIILIIIILNKIILTSTLERNKGLFLAMDFFVMDFLLWPLAMAMDFFVR